ncbi:hypothetical protein STRIP9103_04586 [Streptomyces ipomoeae 91-03]|uniref:Uncharacterized protein n=1 Tax=Streptomyces ipomoeae 91-03 TaxID=698759 RepID=L1L0D8_9ACTN|nr:hypothetical protein STRIP9103_04586 [Streptomyces ipomoeae 91-03]
MRLPTDVTFFSPWRGTDRPVFGFLHACWAFALTVLYTREARRSATLTVAPFLDAHLRQQEVHFAAATKQLEQALSYVTAHEIRERIGRAVGKVVGPAGSEGSPFCL